MKIRQAISAVVAFIAVAAVLAALLIVTGVYDVAADKPHTALVRTLIEYARDRSIAARDGEVRVPRLDDPRMIAGGAAHYDAMCTGCHLAPGMADNEMRPGMNPKPPMLAALDRGDPREQFWFVKHGIKMTGMPAWGVTHTDAEIWEIVAFLQVLPKLSPAGYRRLVAQAPEHEEHMNMPH